MPPAGPSMPPEMPPGMGMPPEMPPGGGAGEVMMSIPKSAFDQLHQIVMQLATGLDELSNGINQQAAGAGGPPPMPGGEMEDEMEMEGASPEDEEFLRSLMSEGNAKTR